MGNLGAGAKQNKSKGGGDVGENCDGEEMRGKAKVKANTESSKVGIITTVCNRFNNTLFTLCDQLLLSLQQQGWSI